MEYKSLTASQFADGMEVPRAVISHILSERNKPSLDVVLKIISTYRDISLKWLLLGEGNMLNDLVTNMPENVAELDKNYEVQRASTVANVSPKQEDKVQNPKEESSSAFPVAATNKAIERVMIFYTDHTFSSYTPE
ncbi:helix-turn-helix domain-containing protein [Pontibacter silvestris]|uniref:Helix-turn-helix domain-containing protein n=2 Tax=Pontibacter silvestris TaxID=2305183 RepID=A0ABW4WVW1_9BACT